MLFRSFTGTSSNSLDGKADFKENSSNEQLSDSISEKELTESSSPDIPPVEIAKPSSTLPNEVMESKNEDLKPQSKSVSPIIGNITSSFDGFLTEAQLKRLVPSSKTLSELYAKAKNYDGDAYTQLSGKRQAKTWSEFMADVDSYGCGFLKKSHRGILIAMSNRDEAYSIGMAAMLTGKQVTYASSTLPTKRYESLVSSLNIDVAFIDNTIIDNFKDVQKTHEDLQVVVVGIDVGKDKNICSLKVFFDEKMELSDFQRKMKELKSETIAEVVPVMYGDTYKGVIWTHGNIMSSLEVNNPGFDAHMTMMEVLPQASFGERLYGLYEAMNFQLHVFIAQPQDLQFSGEQFMKSLKKVHPKFMLGVPRVYEKIALYAEKKIDSSTLLTRKMKGFAATKGVDGASKQGVGESKPKGYGLSRTLVYNKALKAIGLHKCYCACWGIMPEASRSKCQGLGISVFEGLILPETTGFCLKQRRNLYVPGTYGCKVTSDVQVELDNGEVVVSGPTVSPGYSNEGNHLKYPFEKGFKTRMLATKANYGKEKEPFYKPNGYKHPLIITTTGEMVDPHYLEISISTIPTIEKVIVVGEGEKFISALLQINYERAKEELKEKCAPKDTIKKDPFFGTYLRQRIEAFNQTLPRSIRIKKFVIVELPEATLPEEGNTSMESRGLITKRFTSGIQKLYHPPKVDESQDHKKKIKEEEEIQKKRRKEEKERETARKREAMKAKFKKGEKSK